MTLEFILYSSEATGDLCERDVWDIVYRSVRNNEQDQITGFLHHGDGHFLQYLEGPTELLQHRVDRISGDPRHGAFRIIAMGPLSERLFPEWDMGLIDPISIPKRGLLFRRSWTKAIHELEPEAILGAITRHSGSVSRLKLGLGPHAGAFFPERIVSAAKSQTRRQIRRANREANDGRHRPRWL